MGYAQVRGEARPVILAAEHLIDVLPVAGQPLPHKLALHVVVGRVGRHPINFGCEGENAQRRSTDARAIGQLVAPVQLVQPLGAHGRRVGGRVRPGVHQHQQLGNLGGGRFEQQLMPPVRRPELAHNEASARGWGHEGGSKQMDMG